jgi:uncharacterized protein (TIRG00374 family)
MLSVLFVLAFAWRVDMPAAVRRLAAADMWWAMIGLAAMLLSRLGQAFRWRLLLHRTERLPLRRVAGVHLVAGLASMLLPLRGGDVLRVQIAARRFGVPRSELADGVFVVVTLMDWAASILLLSLALAIFLHPPAFVLPLFAVFTALAATLLAAAVALARIHRRDGFATLPAVRRLPVPLRQAADRLMPRFLDGLTTLRDPHLATRVFGVSLVIWLLEVTVFWALARAFGVPLGFADCFLVMIGANVLLALPFTPWSVGSFEVAVTELLVLMGVDQAGAAGYAIGAHLLITILITLLGVGSTWALGLSPRDLLGGDRERPPAATPAAGAPAQVDRHAP